MQFGQRSKGFTLIEVMVTVAIIGILAAVAYPMYTSQIRKGKRGEARAALMSLLQQQERYMTQMNTYTVIDPAVANTSFKNYSSETYVKSSHVLGAQACQAIGSTTPTLKDCIEVFAQPATGYSDPGITFMAIDTQGRRRCTGSEAETRCWK